MVFVLFSRVRLKLGAVAWCHAMCKALSPTSTRKQTKSRVWLLPWNSMGCDWVRKRWYLRRHIQILISKMMLLPHASVSWLSNPTNNTCGLSCFVLFRIARLPVSGTLKLLIAFLSVPHFHLVWPSYVLLLSLFSSGADFLPLCVLYLFPSQDACACTYQLANRCD